MKKLYNNVSRAIRNIKYYTALIAKDNDVSPPPNLNHSNWLNFLSENFNKKDINILEIGSRVVTGSNYRNNFSNANYIGVDFYNGDNVDIVGDAHKLSTYFEEGTKFDLIFSSAVFEHLHMPWIVAEEVQKLLKIGGCVFIETHFSFSSHERPWNFFQFSDMGLIALFNPSLGFEVIESGMSNPMRGYFSHKADENLRYKPIKELYCHSEIFCKKTKEVSDFKWSDCNLVDIVGDTRYPKPK